MAKRASRRKPPRPGAETFKPADLAAPTVLKPLNFKVSGEFHRVFKTFAAQHGKKMVEVLQEAFASLMEKYGN